MHFQHEGLLLSNSQKLMGEMCNNANKKSFRNLNLYLLLKTLMDSEPFKIIAAALNLVVSCSKD